MTPTPKAGEATWPVLRETLLRGLLVAAVCVTASRAMAAETLRLENPTDGTLEAAGTPDAPVHGESVWALPVAGGESYSITLQSIDFDPALRVIAPDGTVLEDDDSAGQLNARVILSSPISGEATVIVHSYRATGAGAYQILALPHGIRRAEPGSPIEEVLMGNLDSYALSVTPETPLLVTLTSPWFDPKLTVIEPGGARREVDDVSETDPSALCLLSPSVAGTATLEVTGYGGGVGEYTLLVSALQPSAWIDVNSGEEPAAAHAVYREEEGPTIIGVRAEPGQLVVIDARSTEFDTLLTAVTVDGTIRVNDDAPRGRTNDSRVAINAPESGEIFTLTRSFLPNLEGAFTMSVGGQEERVIPQFTLRDTEGVEFSFSDSAGKIRIVDMWATWCGPCLVEIPHFNEIAEEYADRGVAVMGISTEEPQVVRAFTEENVVRYPLLIDTDGSVSAQLELIAQEEPSQVIPTTFVVDGEGRVAAVFRGYREKEVFVREIERLLESSGQSPGGDGG